MTYKGLRDPANPLTLAEALSGNYHIGPGDTVYLRGGTYRGDYICNLNGTADDYIYFQPYENEHVVIDGSLTINGSYTIWRNIEMCYSGWTTRESAQIGSSPTDIPTGKNLSINGAGCKVINCVIHDLSGPGFWTSAIGAEFYGNVVYNIGWLGPDRGHGHLLYMQNETGRKLIKHNVMLNNFGWGIHAYGGSVYLDNFDIIENSIFQSGIYDNNHSNILLGGESRQVRYSVANGNLSYSGGAGLSPYGQGFLDLVCNDNYMPNGINGSSFSEFTSNYTGPAVGNQVFVYPNAYQAARANVTIYNEAGSNGVTIDLTAVTGLSAGDTVTVRNVQDYFEDIQTLTLDAGKCIVVDMQAENRTVAAPIAWVAAPTTFPQFGCFVVEKAG